MTPTRSVDERWIEIGMEGWQVRYTQDNAPPATFSVREDGQSTAVYRHEKKAVIIYDRKDRQYQWVGELGKAFENLRQEGKILQENDRVQGPPGAQSMVAVSERRVLCRPADQAAHGRGRL